MDTGKRSGMELTKKEWIARQNAALISRRAAASRTRMIEKLLAIFRSQAPVGYEDETGFHFGVRPQ